MKKNSGNNPDETETSYKNEKEGIFLVKYRVLISYSRQGFLFEFFLFYFQNKTREVEWKQNKYYMLGLPEFNIAHKTLVSIEQAVHLC